MNKTFSEYGQDNWVINQHRSKRNGFFVDVGCIHPLVKSNTALLDNHYNWRGMCVGTHDVESFNKRIYGKLDWSFRKNTTFIYDNPIQVDYEYVLESLGCRNCIDYLSIGLDLTPNTSHFIDIFPFDRFSVSLITIEMNLEDMDELGTKIVDLGYSLIKTTNTSIRFYRKNDRL